MEHYGDIHLHQTDYPGPVSPGTCDSTNNYFHGNQCGEATKNGHPYDCNCNLCQPPDSLPYQAGPGGHLGSLAGLKPCGNPYCRCTDCDGNCKCGANQALEQALEVEQGIDILNYFGIGLVVVFFIIWFLKKRRGRK